MTLQTIHYYRRANAAVVLGTAVGCAVLAGALLVGTSVRESLRSIALGRLGPFRIAIESNVPKPAGGALAAVGSPGESVVRLLRLDVSAVSERNGSRAGGVQLIAVEETFWHAYGMNDEPSVGCVFVNETLARELGVAAGDELIVSLPVHSPIPSESLIGRREGRVRKWRARVERVLPNSGAGGFDTTFGQAPPLNVLANLAEVQTASRQAGFVNLCLSSANADDSFAAARVAVRAGMTLEDTGLRIRTSTVPGGPAFVIESDSLVVRRALEDAIAAIAAELNVRTERVLTHLANTIRRQGDDAAFVPYSVVAATEMEIEPGLRSEFITSTQSATGPIASAGADSAALASDAAAAGDRVYLNEWAANRIRAKTGDVIELEYHMLDPGGTLRTERRTLPLAGIVNLAGATADETLTPEYPGISNARRMGDWDPPFPVDFKRIGREDEDYWDRYRATPKAFVPLATGQKWWADERELSARFGRVTSIRVFDEPANSDFHSTRPSLASTPDSATRPADGFQRSFVERLVARIEPETVGIVTRDLRAEAESAAGGTTDFGGLFIGFSMFLIAAAALLVGLIFRLNIEQRARQIGVMLAVGWNAGDVRRLLMREGIVLAAIGALLGAPAALGYAWLMIAGLRTLWQSAVGTSELQLFASLSDVVVGAAIGFAVACGSLAWAVRSVGRRSPAALLAGRVDGWTTDARQGADRSQVTRSISLAFAVIAISCVAASIAAAQTGRAALFFAAGAAALIAALTAFAEQLKHRARDTGIGAVNSFASQSIGLWRLGVRQSARRPDRSIATVCMFASATFVVVAVAASRHEPRIRLDDRLAGHGGFALYGRSTAPLLYDPGTPSGREKLGIDSADEASLADSRIIALRYRSGDDASCLNLYKPQSPAIIGVPNALVERGGFTFASTLAARTEERSNPWLLLNRKFDDGAVPVFGDASTVTWLLKLGLGSDFVMRGDDGRETRLRIVGTFAGSIFQSELVTSERHFLRAFQRTDGYRALLVETTAEDATSNRATEAQTEKPEALSVSAVLERGLADFGLDLSPTVERLAAFARVENTYLSTFQLLGGLGLLLGTLGVAAMTLRNALERRSEIALLAAVGLSRMDIARLMLGEVGYSVVVGVSIGTGCAILAVAPNALTTARGIPWGSLFILILGVCMTGLVGAAIAIASCARGRMVDALRTA